MRKATSPFLLFNVGTRFSQRGIGKFDEALHISLDCPFFAALCVLFMKFCEIGMIFMKKTVNPFGFII